MLFVDALTGIVGDWRMLLGIFDGAKPTNLASFLVFWHTSLVVGSRVAVYRMLAPV